MDHRLLERFKVPNIGEYEDVDLLALREQCDVLEQQLRELLPNLPERLQQKLLCYLDLRDELEVQMIKAVFRWGKRQGK